MLSETNNFEQSQTARTFNSINISKMKRNYKIIKSISIVKRSLELNNDYHQSIGLLVPQLIKLCFLKYLSITFLLNLQTKLTNNTNQTTAAEKKIKLAIGLQISHKM